MKKSTTRKLIGSAIIILLLLLFLGYYKLGGLNSIQVETVAVDDYRLVGRHFDGNYKSDTVRMYFEEMRDYVKEGIIKGQPVIIYDKEPTGNRASSKSYIGIRVLNGGSTVSALEKRQIRASKAIRVSKDAHISVMPNPDKIERMIQDYADEHQLEIGGSNIEIYYPGNRLVIERPVLISE